MIAACGEAAARPPEGLIPAPRCDSEAVTDSDPDVVSPAAAALARTVLLAGVRR